MKKKENNEKQIEVEKILLELSALEQKALFEKYQTDEEGLDPVQASDRLEEYGRNIIDFGKEKSLAVRIKDAIINPFNIVLLVVAMITFVTDVVMAEEPSFATFIMLVAVIIISASISFVQEEKSNNAAKKLQGMITTKLDVIHTIRTPKLPFINDRASIQLTLSTLAIIAVTLLIGFTGIAGFFSLPVMPVSYMLWLALLMVVYMIFAQIMKVIYIRKHKDWY